MIRETPDAYLGLEAPSPAEWSAWHHAMLELRAGHADYDDPSTDWSDETFRQVFLFMYDASFFDRVEGCYRTGELVDRWSAMFGRVDSVLLWHAYPRLGFDARTQFDFYRDMPGGLARLRSDVVDVFHARGIRVFVDYNPWAEGGHDELGAIVAALDADGVMLDTMTDAPDALERAVLAHKSGVVFAPELRPRASDLARHRQSWAQWPDLGDGSAPSILKHRWLVPRHRQFLIRRWDVSRRKDIVDSFFDGTGLLLWDDIFGAWNPYSQADRRLVAETGAVLDRYGDVFARGEWLPLIPTGRRGLDAHRWSLEGRAIITLRNRSSVPLAFVAPPGRWLAFWGDRRDAAAIPVEPGGVQAIVLDDPEALAHFDELSRRADVPRPAYDERAPRPRLVAAPSSSPRPPDASFVALPAGDFTMRIRHERRECGCYPLGATDDAMWGWFYKDPIEHTIDASVRAFAMRRTAVTNAEFLAFVHEAGYEPRDPERFLEHLPRPLPDVLADDLAGLPVTFVSLDDARAFAAWRGERLPSEAEWQWAAEGCGLGRAYPWGDEPRTFPERIRPAVDPGTATPQGVMGLSGNTWELTESEHTDGHTRFVMLRGGVFLPPGESEWLPARGARPNGYHAKYILLSDGLDRSETVSFRTVVEM